MKLKEKIPIANELLEWLKDHNFESTDAICGVHHCVIVPFSEHSGHEYYNTWKAWDLLRKEGRIEGKYGVYKIVRLDAIVEHQMSIASIEEIR